MAYDGRIMRRALDQFESDRQIREDGFRRRREEIFRRQPRLRRIQEQLNTTMGRIITSALRRGADARAAVEMLRSENLGLQEERERLLREMGLTPDALEEKAACPLCGDTGYRGEAVCRCLRRYYAQAQKEELSRMLDLAGQNFDTFSLDWYAQTADPAYGISPRANMETIYEICANYAHTFGPRSGNLLLFGAPGLGKTFLSAAIAKEVSDGGFSVVYDTAGHVFDRFEMRKFGRMDDGDPAEDVERILRCDLLILDDLGTEANTPFVSSALYEMLNTRLLTKRSTIINTNLQPEQLAKRYSAQIASRVEGEYRMLPFFGADIRRLKKSRS